MADYSSPRGRFVTKTSSLTVKSLSNRYMKCFLRQFTKHKLHSASTSLLFLFLSFPNAICWETRQENRQSVLQPIKKWLLFNFCKSSTLEEWRISRLPPGLLSETIHSENKMMRRDWAVLPPPLRGGKKRKTTEKTALPSPLALNLSKEGTKSRLIRFYFMVISVFPSAPFFHD